ncbi:MAG: hypothetical protein Q7R95_03115 [bacterium]|nr:hypothetical protein [bacterium]
MKTSLYIALILGLIVFISCILEYTIRGKMQIFDIVFAIIAAFLIILTIYRIKKYGSN